MVPDAYRKLITKLALRTSKGEVNWRTTSEEGKFIVNFTKGFTVSVSHYWYESQDFVKVSILDSEGKEIDFFVIDDGDNDWYQLNEMYNTARRTALNINKAIEAISEELESEGTIGEEGEDIPF